MPVERRSEVSARQREDPEVVAVPCEMEVKPVAEHSRPTRDPNRQIHGSRAHHRRGSSLVYLYSQGEAVPGRAAYRVAQDRPSEMLPQEGKVPETA